MFDASHGPAQKGGKCWACCKRPKRKIPYSRTLVRRGASSLDVLQRAILHYAEVRERLDEAMMEWANVDADEDADEEFERAWDRVRKAWRRYYARPKGPTGKGGAGVHRKRKAS